MPSPAAATDGDQIETNTFVFADLAGFTALTEAHGDSSAIRFVDDFVARVRRILADYDAEEVKTIGDEVMIRASDPTSAVRLGAAIVDQLAFHGSPPVRVGITPGPRSTATATGSARRSTSPRGLPMRPSRARCCSQTRPAALSARPTDSNSSPGAGAI